MLKPCLVFGNIWLLVNTFKYKYWQSASSLILFWEIQTWYIPDQHEKNIPFFVSRVAGDMYITYACTYLYNTGD